MGAVFLAHDPEHEREVVVKVLPPQINSPALQARFVREIQAIAALSHPNIVKVLDFSTGKDLPYYVMPYLPIRDLRVYLTDLRTNGAGPGAGGARRSGAGRLERSAPPGSGSGSCAVPAPATTAVEGWEPGPVVGPNEKTAVGPVAPAPRCAARTGARPLPLSLHGRVRSIFLDVCSALAHCHEHGVVHRDLKPENILVDTEANRGILSDFGLALVVDATNLTKSREMLGTISYMSPEMLRAGDVGPTSDVYQIALVIYEVFAGDLPLRSDNPVTTASRRVTETIPPLCSVNWQVAPAFSEILSRALRPDPADRFRDMGEFHEALKATPSDAWSGRISGQMRRPASQSGAFTSMTMVRPSLSPAVESWWVRRRALALVGALLSGLVGLLAIRTGPGREAAVASAPASPVESGSASPGTEDRAATSRIEELVEAVRTIDIDRECRLMGRNIRRKGFDLRGFEASYREGVFRSVLRALERALPFGPAFFRNPRSALAERYRAYRVVAPLLPLQTLLRSVRRPSLLPVAEVLGEGFSPATIDRLPAARTVELPVLGDCVEIRLDNVPAVDRVDSLTADFIKVTRGKKFPGHFVWTVQVDSLSKASEAQVCFGVGKIGRGVYLALTINDTCELILVPPEYRQVKRRDPLVLFHTFDPAFLREGANRFKVRAVGVVGVADVFNDKDRVEIVFAELKLR
jgi:serine/threonine protein kinase